MPQRIPSTLQVGTTDRNDVALIFPNGEYFTLSAKQAEQLALTLRDAVDKIARAVPPPVVTLMQSRSIM